MTMNRSYQLAEVKKLRDELFELFEQIEDKDEFFEHSLMGKGVVVQLQKDEDLDFTNVRSLMNLARDLNVKVNFSLEKIQ